MTALALSADGRYLAFTSVANSLDALAVDVNGLPNIYRRDMQTGDTLLIDRIIATNTAATGGLAGKPSISADGNCVAWTTSHTGNTIVAGTLSSFNVFVRQRDLGHDRPGQPRERRRRCTYNRSCFRRLRKRRVQPRGFQLQLV